VTDAARDGRARRPTARGLVVVATVNAGSERDSRIWQGGQGRSDQPRPLRRRRGPWRGRRVGDFDAPLQTRMPPMEPRARTPTLYSEPVASANLDRHLVTGWVTTGKREPKGPALRSRSEEGPGRSLANRPARSAHERDSGPCQWRPRSDEPVPPPLQGMAWSRPADDMGSPREGVQDQHGIGARRIQCSPRLVGDGALVEATAPSSANPPPPITGKHGQTAAGPGSSPGAPRPGIRCGTLPLAAREPGVQISQDVFDRLDAD